jgi:ribosome-associated protein
MSRCQGNVQRGQTVTGDASTPNFGSLRLDHFVKLRAMSGTGGQAKLMIQNGEVKVNGETETRRRRKLSVGDVVEVGGKQFVVEQNDSSD